MSQKKFIESANRRTLSQEYADQSSSSEDLKTMAEVRHTFY